MLFYSPTVITDLTNESPAWSQEIFGPVAPVRTFSTIEEAAGIINASEYGLSVGLLGYLGVAMKLADMVRSGKLHINEQTVSDESYAPCGWGRSSGGE